MTEAKPGGKPDRTWIMVAVGLVVLWMAYLLFLAPIRTGSGPRLENSGLAHPADYSWQLLDLSERPVTFDQFKGKTIFLNVWATWCGPCVREMPSIARLAANPKMKGVAFVCVSTDDSGPTVKRFLAGKNWPMTILRAESLPPVFATEGIPATFIIAPDGKVVASEIGSADWDGPEVVAFLEKVEGSR
jgi:thiol-disulfide isomerase/thioredoxin